MLYVVAPITPQFLHPQWGKDGGATSTEYVEIKDRLFPFLCNSCGPGAIVFFHYLCFRVSIFLPQSCGWINPSDNGLIILIFRGQEQWAQCDSCSKWRRLPVDVLLPPKWTCAENAWDQSR